MRNLIQVVIADDDAEQADNLKALVARLRPSWHVLPIALSVDELKRALDEQVPDILLLDLHMPGLGHGGNTLDVVRSDSSSPVVVLITGDPTYALQAYERAVGDYVVKPVRPARLEQALCRVESMLGHRAESAVKGAGTPAAVSWIAGARGRDVVFINPRDIVYLQAERKYTIAVLEEGQVLLRRGITEIEAVLDGEKFVRIHRSTIVNIGRADFLRRDEMGRLRLHLKSRPDSLIVSRSFESVFKDY